MFEVVQPVCRPHYSPGPRNLKDRLAQEQEEFRRHQQEGEVQRPARKPSPSPSGSEDEEDGALPAVKGNRWGAGSDEGQEDSEGAAGGKASGQLQRQSTDGGEAAAGERGERWLWWGANARCNVCFLMVMIKASSQWIMVSLLASGVCCRA